MAASDTAPLTAGRPALSVPVTVDSHTFLQKDNPVTTPNLNPTLLLSESQSATATGCIKQSCWHTEPDQDCTRAERPSRASAGNRLTWTSKSSKHMGHHDP